MRFRATRAHMLCHTFRVPSSESLATSRKFAKPRHHYRHFATCSARARCSWSIEYTGYSSVMSHVHIHQDLEKTLQLADQAHLLADWDSLTADQTAELAADIQVHDEQSCLSHTRRIVFSMRSNRHSIASLFACRSLTWHMSTAVTKPAGQSQVRVYQFSSTL